VTSAALAGGLATPQDRSRTLPGVVEAVAGSSSGPNERHGNSSAYLAASDVMLRSLATERRWIYVASDQIPPWIAVPQSTVLIQSSLLVP
jgi:hypothetical protein